MSEYWVSKKKYWCQYCETFIADDAPSRTQHEGGLRHKGNKERYIRGLYKTGMKKKQDSEEEKRTMKFVEAAAQAAFAQDVSSGSASASATTASTSKPKPAPKPADRFANYTTAQSLGITDPDAELQAAEELKKNEGVAGEWVSVVPPPPPLPEEFNPLAAGSSVDTETNASGQIRKREDVDEEDTRQFKLRRKTVAVGLGEIYDPGIIKVKPRTDISQEKENEGQLLGDNTSATSSYPSLSAGTEKPVWVSRGWKKAGELTSTLGTSATHSSAEISLENTIKEEGEEDQKPKIEDISELATDLPKLPQPESLQKDPDQAILDGSVIKKEEEQNITLVKSEPEASTPGLFRKRKVPLNPSAGKRRDR